MHHFLAFIAFLLPFALCGQTPAVEAEALFRAWHDQSAGLENLPLMKGKIYQKERQGRTTHPFFRSKTWTPGSLQLDGQQYDHILLLYDLENDLLVMSLPSLLGEAILPDQDLPDHFVIHEHFFGRVPSAKAKGFFDFLYAGDSLTLLAKRQKNLRADKGGSEYEEDNDFFILYKEALHPVKNLRSLKKLFPEKRKILKKIPKKEKLKFSVSREPQMIAFIRSFDQTFHP